MAEERDGRIPVMAQSSSVVTIPSYIHEASTLFASHEMDFEREREGVIDE